MPLINSKDMLEHAHQNGYAVGAFDLTSIDFLEAIISAAERARAPVILSLSESRFEHFDFELVMAAVETAANRSNVPVAIHLNHCANLESAIRAIRMGCNSIALDTAHRAIGENLDTTRAAVKMAHACGVMVEGEMGYVPGLTNTPAKIAVETASHTTLAEAKGYVERTDIDSFSVSIGTVYGHTKGKLKLNWNRLKEINAALGIPLVIHGGSGLSDDQFRKLIMLGVAKINYHTTLSELAGGIIRTAAKLGAKGYIGLMAGVREVVSGEVERCIRLWGSAGRAAEVLAQCQPWLNVVHVVVYNAPVLDAAKLRSNMADGQRQLSTIPGVREVRVGSVADKSARYRHCWMVRLASAAAIDSFVLHPAYINFTEQIFYPAAADRLTADYCVVGIKPGAIVLPISNSPATAPVQLQQKSQNEKNKSTSDRNRHGIGVGLASTAGRRKATR